MDLSLNGKVALITGAGSPVGFGRGIALTLASAGCDIVANDIDLEGAEKTAAEVKAFGRKALAVKADVTQMAEVNDMVKAAIKTFGKIDILVNNAGRAVTPRPFAETPERDWEIVINLNLYGVLNCTKAVLPLMLERKYGKIVNISSGAGLGAASRMLIYGMTKAAVISFTKSLAREVISSGIYVNCVAPGFGDTNFLRTANFPPDAKEHALKMIPTGRATTPQDVGNMVAYLASDIANDIVGQTFLVDGGLGL
jgi:NAD(P)-dependent dehydrogenase (short-subunit alcohol dehydrogenase family)